MDSLYEIVKQTHQKNNDRDNIIEQILLNQAELQVNSEYSICLQELAVESVE